MKHSLLNVTTISALVLSSLAAPVGASAWNRSWQQASQSGAGSGGGSGFGAGQRSHRRTSSSGSSRKIMCVPTDAVTAGAPTPASPPTSTTSTTPVATASPTPTPPAGIDGYLIEITRGEGDQGVLAAQLLFGTVTTGRSRLAGYADVSNQQAASSQSTSAGMDLKSTSESPFQFELTISTTQDPQGGFDGTLLDADLFTGAPLSNVPYKCWFQR